ncbi:hypothetical protein SLEP1_g14866 [Rubroshorea leprosula]|uniref:AAA+ ATPase domain-containing protein n=1 Tax=Rubroshorea leprosula TaxID=152421 RepID=A0AAV5IRG7_9ROSI|nr:hypothetical protein SLEP1_g14866 [Rubroshorea leprosula]
MCLNPLSRYKLSKRAEEDSQKIAKHVQKVPGFNLRTSYPVIPQRVVAAPVKDFQEFESRMGVLDDMMKALQSPNINIIGLHGMPGVGKTMLLKEVKRKAEQEKLFNAVVMVSVAKKNPDYRIIQDGLAYGLGVVELSFGIGDPRVADPRVADRLRAKILEERKVLVILDDIWDKLDLKELGIPFEDQQRMNAETGSSSTKDQQMKCKILLSSRELNVLSIEMGTQKEIVINQLEDQEAWQMFKKIVGDRAESSELQPTGFGIATECKGLPLAITTLAKALKNKSLHEWKSALQRMKSPSPSNFEGIHAKVYTAIEVSYNHLGSGELKRTFLLSSLICRNASIQDLLKYGVGLGWFPQANTIDGARNDLLTLISNLKASSLLIDGSHGGFFDVHDVIRAVALSIACRDGYGLFLTDDDLPKKCSDEKALNDFKWICLEYTNMNELPNELESPQLTFFCLSNKYPSLEIPANFFKGMQRLRVLDLTHLQMSSLPSSISLLENLHTLCLDQGVLGDISIIGELKNLEVLSLVRSDIKMLPREIGQLTRLKLLDLSGCKKLRVILPRVLASMSRLEELYLGNSFNRWEHDEHESQRNASLAELKQLKKLTALEIRIPDVKMIPEDLSFEKLERCKIFIGDAWNKWDSSAEISRILKLRLRASISFDSSLKQLLKMSEELHLEELKGVKHILYGLASEGFQKLKYLHIRNASDIQGIIMDSAGLCNAFPTLLKVINVECCNQLKMLFSFSTARQLFQLQEIGVTDCRNMVNIVDEEGKEDFGDIVEATDQMVKLAHLLSLRLQNLPKFISFCHEYDTSSSHVPLFSEKMQDLQNLVRFCSGNCIMAVPSLKRLTIENCPNLKEFLGKSLNTDIATDITPLFNEQLEGFNLQSLELSGNINIQQIWHNRVPEMSSLVRNLKVCIVKGCGSLKYLLTSSMVKSLVNLEGLVVENCKMMEGVIVAEEGFAEEVTTQKIFFPNLQSLALFDLPKLKRFCSGNYIEFPCLTRLYIIECPLLKAFTSSPVIGDTVVSTEKAENTSTPLLFDAKVALPMLESLIINQMRSLDKIWHNQLDADSFCKLKDLAVTDRETLESIFPFSMLERLQRLEKLLIRRCDSLEVIFEPQGHIAIYSQALVASQPTLVETETKLVLPKLIELRLGSLPKLKGFCHPVHFISLRNLQDLEVSTCHGLVSLMRYSTAKSLVQLARMSISDCDMIGEIVSCIDDEVKDGVVFSQLKYLRLSHLPRLATFCSVGCNFEFPSLEDIIVMGCPNMQLFSRGELSTPKLQKVKFIEEDDGARWEGDLNTTLQRLFMEKVGYHGLENLKISEFELVDQAIIEIWNKNPRENLPFRNLKSLEVSGYSSWRYLLTPSMALGLVKLQDLRVSNCATMEHVITGDGADEVFPQLNSINLESCSNLTCFYEGSSTLNLPSLEEITVANCTAMVTFVSGSSKEQDNVSTSDGAGSEERHDIPIQPFFSNKMMEAVIVTEDGFAEEEKTQKIFFPNLLVLVLDDLPKLKRFCSGNYIEFPCLVVFGMRQCPLLKAFTSSPVIGDIVVSTEEAENNSTRPLFDAKVVVPVLEILVVNHMESLDKIWHNQLDAESFCKLQVLQVIGCKTLESFFPFSMLERLQRLEQLFIRSCDSLEEIFEPEGHIASYSQALVASQPTLVEAETKLVLPKLVELGLESLPKLKGFCHPIHIKCPSLKKLEVFGFQQLEIFAFEFPSFQSTTSDHQLETRQHPLFWINKATFSNLEELKLEKIGSLKEIWRGQYAGGYFPKLKKLELIHFSEQSVVSSFFFQSLPCSLEELVVSYASFNEIFQCEGSGGEGRPAGGLTQLRELRLSNLNELMHLWKVKPDFETIVYNLRALEVLECSKLMNLVPSIISMRNLQDLEVSRCHALVSLLRYSTAKSLVQLTRMSISDCDMIGEIVACIDDEVKDGIVFSKLKYLRLKGLPMLANFCSVECNFEFPFLKDLIVMDCPDMQFFSKGELITPKLQKVKLTEEDDEGRWEGDLNATLQQLKMSTDGSNED